MRYRIRQNSVALTAVAVFIILLVAPASPVDTDPWERADRPRTWSFPRDHGAHPTYRTEWWYFTGNLADTEMNRYGYQLTFFRQGVRREPTDPKNPWSVRDLYLAHLAVTDVARNRFLADERTSRQGPGLAGAKTNKLDVWLLGWSAKEEGGAIVLEASDGSASLRLALKPSKPVVLHGDRGLSKKGSGAGQASYYASFTDLRTTGLLGTPSRPQPFRVTGVSWFDHEFGSNQLTEEQRGWDWFSLHLSDGRDLMLYFLRRKDGSVEPASSGTLVDRSGQARHLPLSDVRLRVLDHWKSPRSGGLYPSQWHITLPSERLDLVVAPLLRDQELVTTGSTGVTYWEGVVQGQGTSKGRKVTCQGYTELTGYARSLGGLF